MQEFLASFLLISVSELGDKTQILAFLLATQFKRPWTILSGIFVSVGLSGLFAASIGRFLSGWISSRSLSIILAVLFFTFAFLIWKSKDDEDEACEAFKSKGTWGIFVTTFLLFFVAELGDKTQVVTAALGAKYQSILFVTLGMVCGMMLISSVTVFVGDRLASKINRTLVRRVSAIIFVIFGVLSIRGAL